MSEEACREFTCEKLRENIQSVACGRSHDVLKFSQTLDRLKEELRMLLDPQSLSESARYDSEVKAKVDIISVDEYTCLINFV